MAVAAPTPPTDTGSRSMLSSRSATASVATTILGWMSIISFVVLAFLGLVVSPRDVNQGESVRFFYLHLPSIYVAYGCFVIAAVSSALLLWRGSDRPDKGRHLDRVAGAAAEVGVVFTALTIITGAMWGRLTWGVYWQWDARLTMTAIMFVSYLGYLALRRVPADPVVRSRRTAIVALVSAVNLPIVHFSVDWWVTLHQESSIRQLEDPDLTFDMFAVFLFAMVAFTLVTAWLLIHRYRVIRLEEILEEEGLEAALAARRAEQGRA